MAITTLNLRALNRSDTASSGQVITATSATAADFQTAASGAWTWISTTAMTGASSILVEGLNSTYDVYKVVLSNLHLATEDGSQNVTAQFKQGGSIIAGSSYTYSAVTTITNTEGNAYSSASAAYLEILNNGTGNPTAEVNDIIMYIYHPASTSTYCQAFWTKIGYTHDNRITQHSGGGALLTTAATTGVQFATYTGNFDGGNARLYGLANS
tara:strand:- start:310 stop:945 length:636 start_codon:yes stop_codon:yes gene_type:complete